MAALGRAARLAPAVLPAVILAGCDPANHAGVPGDSGDQRPFAQIAPGAVIEIAGAGAGGLPSWRGKIAGDEVQLDLGAARLAGDPAATLADGGSGLAGAFAFRVSRFAGRGGLAFSGHHGGQAIDLAITPGKCRTGAEEEAYPYVATLMIGSKLREGCGRITS